MTKKEIRSLKDTIQQEIVRRTALGGYSQDATSILDLYQTAFVILHHLEGPPKKRKKKKK